MMSTSKIARKVLTTAEQMNRVTDQINQLYLKELGIAYDNPTSINIDHINELLSEGADFKQSYEGMTLLHICALSMCSDNFNSGKSKEIIAIIDKMINIYGMNVNTQSPNGTIFEIVLNEISNLSTKLSGSHDEHDEWYFSYGLEHAFELIKFGSDINSVNKNSLTLVEVILDVPYQPRPHTTLMRLFHLGANPNSTNKDGLSYSEILIKAHQYDRLDEFKKEVLEKYSITPNTTSIKEDVDRLSRILSPGK